MASRLPALWFSGVGRAVIREALARAVVGLGAVAEAGVRRCGRWRGLVGGGGGGKANWISFRAPWSPDRWIEVPTRGMLRRMVVPVGGPLGGAAAAGSVPALKDGGGQMVVPVAAAAGLAVGCAAGVGPGPAVPTPSSSPMSRAQVALASSGERRIST